MKSVKRAAAALLLIIGIFFCSPSVYALPFFWDVGSNEVRVPIIMYHLITENGRLQGKFGISPAEMEADLKYLSENGYETIVIDDLVSYVSGWGSLPDKPVILTFDDGCGSDYRYLYPLLEKYDMKAVLSIVGKFTDDYSADETSARKPHLVWEQIKEMHKSKHVEIQNHSYNLHGGSGSGRKRGESDEAYHKRLKEDISKAQERIRSEIRYTPCAFTYPLGVIGKGSKEVLKELKMEAALTCEEGINIIKRYDEDALFHLKRNIRRSGRPVSAVLKKLEKD